MKKAERQTPKRIQKYIFRTQFCLIFVIICIIGAAALMINIHTQNSRRDENLQSIALTLANSDILTSGGISDKTAYLDSLKEKLPSIDVISIVSADHIRLYHTNHSLIGSVYDGNQPNYSDGELICTANDKGPSGAQRRVYAAVYSNDGTYLGFVMTVALMDSIRKETVGMILVYAVVMLGALAFEFMLSGLLSKRIRKTLNGYEPDVFSAMYRIRDNILESLNEGVVALDPEGKVQFANKSAIRMLAKNGKDVNALSLGGIHMDEEQKNISLCDTILLDIAPIREEERMIGSIGILHDRAEYTKLMEDLSGTRYLVDSMRANNHDFTNKLHVILGLIQMEMYKEATSYIENVTIVQRQTIGNIMNAVSEPAVAALLIGKNARAAELNIKFSIREGSVYRKGDVKLPPTVLVTLLGKLVDNALDAMNEIGKEKTSPNVLTVGLYSKKGSLLLTVEDTGSGIEEENLGRIFEKGYSTKGNGHGTGLYQIKCLTEQSGGTITVESEIGKGTSFTVKFAEDSHV